jgi:hypothetical protein
MQSYDRMMGPLNPWKVLRVSTAIVAGILAAREFRTFWGPGELSGPASFVVGLWVGLITLVTLTLGEKLALALVRWLCHDRRA